MEARRGDDFAHLRSEVFTSYQAADYPRALELALRSVDRFPQHRAEASFWAACVHSLMGDPAAAIHVLHGALDRGMWWAPTLLQGPDLDAARATAEFAGLSSRSEHRWLEACSRIEPTVRLHVHPRSAGGLLVAMHGWTAREDDMEASWSGVVDAGLTLAYVRSSQPYSSDLTRFYWVDAEHSSRDISHAIEVAHDRLGYDPDPILLGGFSAGGRLALELALRGKPVDIRAAIAIGAAFPADLGDFPIAGRRDLRAWLLVGEQDRFREPNEAVAAMLLERNVACRLIVVPNLGHDVPSDLSGRLHEAIAFAVGEQP